MLLFSEPHFVAYLLVLISQRAPFFFFFSFETKAVSEMANVTTVTIEQHNTISLNTDKLTHTGDIYNRDIYIYNYFNAL